MMTSVKALAGPLDGRSFLLIGVAILAVLLLAQVLWAYRNTSGSRAGPAKRNQDTGSESSSSPGTGGSMMMCPECGEPTEVEYRLCRHCVEDTGRSHAGSGGDGGSRSSGMF